MTKPYADRLPRWIKTKEVCVALDDNGRRCDLTADVETYYHGSRELESGVIAGWVVVKMCETHGAHAVRELESNLSNREWFRRKRAGKLMFPRLRTDGVMGN